MTDLPKEVRDIAWKAQRRLCKRYRVLIAMGKRATAVATAVAREMAAFLWAIAQVAAPKKAASSGHPHPGSRLPHPLPSLSRAGKPLKPARGLPLRG